MKKLYIMLPVMILILAGLVMAGSVTRNMPSRAHPGETLTIKFQVDGMEAGKKLAIEDMVPNDMVLKEWEVTGSSDAKSAIAYEKKASSDGTKTRYKWSFTASSANPTLSYTIDVTDAMLGEKMLTLTYIMPPATVNTDEKTLTIANIACGDGFCEGDETYDTCLADCAAPEEEEEEEEVTEEKGPSPLTGWIIVAVIVIVGVILYLLLTRKKKPTKK